jgi:hypothetical protein
MPNKLSTIVPLYTTGSISQHHLLALLRNITLRKCTGSCIDSQPFVLVVIKKDFMYARPHHNKHHHSHQQHDRGVVALRRLAAALLRGTNTPPPPSLSLLLLRYLFIRLYEYQLRNGNNNYRYINGDDPTDADRHPSINHNPDV